MKKIISTLTILLLAALTLNCQLDAESHSEKEFVSLFNGKDFSGWTVKSGAAITDKNTGYEIKEGAIHTSTGKGNIYTDKEYSDYIFRFEFKLAKNGNNGLGLRCRNDGSNVAYSNFELQVLDNVGYKGKIKDWQAHASVYGVIPAKQGVLKKHGEWNTEEISFIGTKIKVAVNGTVVVDDDLINYKSVNGKLAGGLHNARGYICFAGHGPGVAYRKLRIKEVANTIKKGKQDNTAPEGFVALFDGKTFNNWKGLMKGGLDNPYKRQKATPEKILAEQKKAEDRRKQHWSIQDGALAFDGKGFSLTTAKKYKDYEFYVDWKILKNGDSGIYLHGTPQVQIWDPTNKGGKKHGADKGSGGLWNNKKEGRWPLVVADNPTGQWNTFFIRMIRGKVTIYLNDKLIINNITLENYWNRKEAALPEEQIELQAHGHKVWFKNIYIREIKTRLFKQSSPKPRALAELELEELKIKYPAPLVKGTEVPKGIPNLKKARKKGSKPALIKIPKGCENVAYEKDVSSSNEDTIKGELEMVTDGDKSGKDDSFLQLKEGLQWVQIDLEESYDIHAIQLWHYHAKPRVYKDVIIQISDDEDFISGVTTVFNNDEDNSAAKGKGRQTNYIEESFGETIAVKGGVKGQYLRFYSNGSYGDKANHYCEIEVYGKEAK
jgi:hypothetical protein